MNNAFTMALAPWLFFVAAVSSATSNSRPRAVFADEDWSEATPASQRVDMVKLKAAVADMDRSFGPDGAKELVVIRNGYLIWKGPNVDAYHNVWSATKVFTSTVLGLLIQDGKCALDDLAVKHLPDLDDQHRAYARIKLRHLASMSSGYKGQLVNMTAEQPWGDPMAYLRPTAPLFESGTQVQYHDHQVFLLGHILTQLAGESEKSLFKRCIADPIGMSQWDWGVSGKVKVTELNNAAGTPSRTPGIQTTARQMARFGLLYLNRGNWQGKQLLPAWFVEEATKNQVPGVGESEFLHARYGFYWCTNDKKPDGKRPWPSAPPRTYLSSGHSCNFCFVIPEWNMVVVRLGTEPVRSGAAGLTEVDRLWDAFFGKLARALQ
jgi:CubicO group peptidase (beta-lactamase class C family)